MPTCTGSGCELPDAAADIERLNSEHTAAVVPKDQEPPSADAVRDRVLRPHAP
jgi:hypothetical protein